VTATLETTFDRPRIPIRLGYLPAGLSHPMGGEQVGPDSPATVLVHLQWRRGNDPDGLHVLVMGQPVVASPPEWPITLGGQPARCIFDSIDYGHCDLLYQEHWVSIEGSGLTLAEAGRIADGVQLAASFTDRTTWFDLDDALPPVP
jgi:hypothetical protein